MLTWHHKCDYKKELRSSCCMFGCCFASLAYRASEQEAANVSNEVSELIQFFIRSIVLRIFKNPKKSFLCFGEIGDDSQRNMKIRIPHFLLLIFFLLSDLGQEVRAQSLPRYELIPGSFTWQEAKLDAERRGGHLATITSKQEWDGMVTLLGDAFKGGLWWLGANNDNPAKEWKWVTGEIWGYTRWASPSEPSGVGAKGPENYLLTWGAGNEFWNDGTGLDHRGYILEVESPPNTYEIIQGTFTWKEAKLDAERRGGHLATITSQQEWDAVVALFGNNLLGVFLGGTDEQQEGVWKWITGEPWNFQNWAGGEPDNSSGAQHYLWLHPAYGLKWDDTASAIGSESKYLLEIESPPNPPVIPPQPPLVNLFTTARLKLSLIQGFRLSLSPPDGLGFRIETSIDLKSWVPLIAFPTNSGPFEIVDSSAVGFTNRFYRAVKY